MRCFRSTLGGSHLARIWLAVATCAPSVFHGTLTADHHLAAGLLHQPLLRVPSRTDDETDDETVQKLNPSLITLEIVF